jgi:hypothetical protein
LPWIQGLIYPEHLLVGFETEREEKLRGKKNMDADFSSSSLPCHH